MTSAMVGPSRAGSKRCWAMTSLDFTRYALNSCVAAVMLSGCAALRQGQDDTPPIAAPGAMAQNPASKMLSRTSDDYKVLHRFRGVPRDGAGPNGLIALGDEFYGTTYGGGSERRGTVFKISTSGRERVLYSFRRRHDGQFPFAGLTVMNDALYGTTAFGGASSKGTLFEVSTSGKERLLYSFKGIGAQGPLSSSNGDGSEPKANLAVMGDELYGTTAAGGTAGPCCDEGCGTVFAFDPSSGDERIVHRFQCNKDGEVPNALVAVNGELFGTTESGGTRGCFATHGCGTVFEIDGSGNERIPYRFRGGTDGAYPSGLVALNGVLYGTTYDGGASKCSNGTMIIGCGTIFEISSSGKERTLYRFQGPDGREPNGLVDLEGTIYGTTAGGGAKGRGTIFTMSTSGDERVIYSFKGHREGKAPTNGLIDVDGALYGTTADGGYHNCYLDPDLAPCGVVFRLTP